MRVSSLSDARVQRLVSTYFVPVWVSRDAYQLDTPAKAERAALAAVDADRRKRGLEGGAVCVYVLAPDGALLATLPVQSAFKPEKLAPFLQKLVEDRKLTARPAATARATAAPPRPAPKPKTAGGRLFHVRTRLDDPGPNRGVSHDTVELTKEQWSTFLAAGAAKVGASWKVDKAGAEELLRHAYPPLPHWSAKGAKVMDLRLTATVTAASAKEVRVKLEGELGLSYPHTGKPTDGRVKAPLVGYLRYDPGSRALTTFHLVSDGAGYVWYWEGKPQPKKMSVAVELQP